MTINEGDIYIQVGNGYNWPLGKTLLATEDNIHAIFKLYCDHPSQFSIFICNDNQWYPAKFIVHNEGGVEIVKDDAPPPGYSYDIEEYM